MKIVEIRAAGLRGATPEGGWTHELTLESSLHTLIAVVTDTGHVGVGSVFTHEALVHGSLEVLRELAVGLEVHSPQAATEFLHQHTFWMGRGGAITHTISGIDIALWDIFGQRAGLPISALLGGGYRDAVTPYASLLMADPDRMRATLERMLGQGFRAFKIGWGAFGRDSARTDEMLVRIARETVGAECLLAVDAGGSDGFWPNGLKWAARTAHMLGDYDIAWFEEPLSPDDVVGFAELTSRSPVRISGGETYTRRQAFAPLFDARALDIVQPDVTKVGGLTDMLEIGRRAEDSSIDLIPHGWNTAVGLAADLHLASALRRTSLVEYCTGASYIDDLVAEPWNVREGRLSIPTAPGLGIAWDEDAIARFTARDGFLAV